MSDVNAFNTCHNQIKRGRKKKRQDGDKCLVCDDESIGINFGVRSCSPCKAFFRRNAIKLGTYEFKCNKDGDCPIGSNTRRSCNCCRLAKCFRVGMDRNAIRTDDQKFERNLLIEYNRQQKVPTNLTIQPVNLFKSSSLSSNDQTLLTNILSAYNQTCISFRYHEHLTMPKDNILSLQTLMNSLSSMYISFVDYFKLIPEFSNLPMDIRVDLLKNNLIQIFRLNSALVIHASGLSEDPNSIILKKLFSENLYSKLCYCAKSLLPFVYDPIFLKLLFIVLIFSTSLSTRYNLNDKYLQIENVLSVQNCYIELLWRYMLYRCSTYEESVRLLTSFITRLLRSQIVNEQLADFVSSTMANQVDQLEPIVKAMWLNEKQLD